MVAVVIAFAIVMGISACGEANVMRAYNMDGSATSEFVAVVADFTAAVHNSDIDHLNQIKDSDGSAGGVTELIAAYGGATLSVLSYDFDHPGEGGAEIAVICTDGGRATFSQGFLGRDSRWRPDILGVQANTPDTDAPLPDEAVSASFPTTPVTTSTTKPAVTYWNQYPPCSSKLVATSTS